MGGEQEVSIIGGGPAGLACSYTLSKKGVKSCIFELEETVGGISKTIDLNGNKFDLGGHRFFTKIEEVSKIWDAVLGDEFILRNRISRIFYREKFFSYPIKILDVVTKLGLKESFLIFLSFCKSKIIPKKEDGSFENYIINRFGLRLYLHFFKTYTEKVWGIPCSKIKSEWASQRIKNLSITTIIWNSLFGGGNVKTLIDVFLYPRFGPGQLYEKMMDEIVDSGNQIKLKSEVVGLNLDEKGEIKSINVDSESDEIVVKTDFVVNTMPLRDLIHRIRPTPPEDVLYAAGRLKYRDFIEVCLVVDSCMNFPDNWLYIHDPNFKASRIQNYKNWSPDLIPNPENFSIGVEFFSNAGDKLWDMQDSKLIDLAIEELKGLELIPENAGLLESKVCRIRKAYPVYDMGYENHLEVVRNYLKSIPNLQTIGRNGMHKYNNMDHSIYTGILAARNILGGKNDVWLVNIDGDYQENLKS